MNLVAFGNVSVGCRSVMYTVLSSLDACGCLGVAAAAAAAAGVFVCHA